MIRFAKHSGIDYIVIDSSFEINGIKAPLQVQIRLEGINDKDKITLYKASSVAFNRNINLTKPKPVEPTKAWWKIW